MTAMRTYGIKSLIQPAICCLFLAAQSLSAQYVFESKKAEKQYYKFDDAYMNYDYDKVLGMEGEMLALFESNEDTVTANVYSFLGEAYIYGLELAHPDVPALHARLDAEGRV